MKRFINIAPEGYKIISPILMIWILTYISSIYFSYYWIGIDGAGPLPKTLEWMGETILGVENTPEYPESFILHDNFPNPFNPVTNISFELPMYTDVNLTIYNLMGQSITTLVDTKMESGYHQVSWNGSDAFGNQMPSGVYFYKVTTENATKTNKMLLLK